MSGVKASGMAVGPRVKRWRVGIWASGNSAAANIRTCRRKGQKRKEY